MFCLGLGFSVVFCLVLLLGCCFQVVDGFCKFLMVFDSCFRSSWMAFEVMCLEI